jgi:plasmid stabilization system protein ParE
MAKRKIIWSNRAKIKLFEILDFFAERNGNTFYSKKLFSRFSKELNLLKKQPEIGVKTDLEGIRGLIVGDYILYYEINSDAVLVHYIWDVRQNPSDLKIK